MNATDHSLINRPIPELIYHIAVPASVGIFFNTLFNAIDTYCAGLISTQALAALSLSFPIFFLILAVGRGFSIGVTALIANALGAGDASGARRFAVQGVLFGLLAAIVLATAGIYLSPVLFKLLGASGSYLALSIGYMGTIFQGCVFFLLNHMFNAILTARGDTRTFRNFLILGCLANGALNPWFIFGGLGIPAMGVVGIALSTILIQSAGCIYLGSRVHHTGLVSGLQAKELAVDLSAFRMIATQGAPAAFNLMTIGIGVFIITYFISPFGKEAVAAYGIAVRIEQIVLLPAIGLNVAVLTLTAQNNGAGRFDRIFEALRTSLYYGGWFMALSAALMLVFSPVLMGVFTRDPGVIAAGTAYLRIDALALYGYVVLFLNMGTLQGLKKPVFVMWMGLFRQVVLPAMLYYLLTRIFNLGLMSIWWGILAITWTAALIAHLFTRRMLKRLFPDSPVCA